VPGTEDRQRRRDPDAIVGQPPMKVVDARDRFAREGKNHVAIPEAGNGGRTLRLSRR